MGVENLGKGKREGRAMQLKSLGAEGGIFWD